jgi:uncharacterized linocin/CFP29 family protein
MEDKVTDFLMRDDAPLTGEEWERLDDVVVSVASRLLVGRRAIKLAGPFGMGTQVVPLDTIEGAEACVHGEESPACVGDECDVVRVSGRKYIPVPVIHKDFMLAWRDIEAARQSGRALDLAPAASASALAALAEDRMIFQDGLLAAEGRQTMSMSDWEASGNAMNDVVAAVATLRGAGLAGPYALVVSPFLYGMLQRPFKNSGRSERKLVGSVADGGIFQSPALDTNQAVLVAHGAQYLDLAVAQDLVTAYLGPEGMDHRFRVLESLALRIKQPGAICVLG